MRTLTFLLFILLISACSRSLAQISIAYDTGKEPVAYAVHQFHQALVQKGFSLTTYSIYQLRALPDISILIKDHIPEGLSPYVRQQDFDAIRTEGYSFRRVDDGKTADPCSR